MMRPAAILLVSVVCGCTVGPDYQQPRIGTPSTYQELPSQAATPLGQVVSQSADLSKWWEQFSDKELESLVSRALAGNLDLMSAASRLREARAQIVVQRAAGLPTINATGATVQLHSNSNPLAALGGGMGGPPASGGTDLHLYSTGFDATWEIDAFGGVRRGVEAANASAEASVWNLRDGEVSLTAEVANDYISLRAAQNRIAVVQTELQRQNDALDLTKARASTGFVTELDVNQQTAQVEATAALLPPLQAQARANIHAIAILLGQQPEEMSSELDIAAAIPGVPQGLPVGLPSELLRRRPDVREAERKLAAATAQIGVAMSDLYPKFNLLGLASFASTSASNLFSSGNFSAGGVGLVRWPIFTTGKIHANIRISEEEEKQAYLAYQKSVLKALGDAEDALARYTTEQQRFVALQRSLAAANSSFAIASDQYRAGFVTYVNVLTAETVLLQARDQATQSQAALAADLVSLYKALGGGWTG